MAKESLSKKDLIKLQATNDLESFIRLVHPRRVLGSLHSELISWATRQDAKSHQLVLLPRDHQKSAFAGYYAAWSITRNPAMRILYMSSTANLAVKQLKFIKDILTSDIYKFYWPEMINPQEYLREKWTETEISIDHPLRKLENVRDPTVFTAGLTTTITGLHCDLAVLDDVVVQENAYTEEGRDKVEQQYSLLASIEGAESKELVVGTRYHPRDLYQTLQEREIERYDEKGEYVSSDFLFEKFERQVESMGDGTGEYLWPRQRRQDGKWFGFDQRILEKKKAQYLDRVQFRAQYYNDPNDPESAMLSKDQFQYYDRAHLKREGGYWYYKGARLNVFAAVDFAFSMKKKADYTAIVVVGVDGNNNYYILDIERFRTDKISEYFKKILQLHMKWEFRKLRAEVSVAQQVIVRDLKDSYIKPHGLALVVDEYRPSRHEGNKEERVTAILEPRYANKQMWHYMGGNCQTLEEELIMANPAHDDIKDALAACLDFAVAPTNTSSRMRQISFSTSHIHPKFGGVI